MYYERQTNLLGIVHILEHFFSVTSQQGLASLSPYLNFDPSYLPVSQPEFIFPDGAVKQRGRFELAFSQIGAACIAGAGIGGASGLYRGVKATSIAGETGKLRRTQWVFVLYCSYLLIPKKSYIVLYLFFTD